jgi:PhnB protein
MHNGKNGVRAIPEGFHTITPHLVVRGGAQAIDFYKKAFGAAELSRAPMPDGKLMHAHLKIGDSQLFLCDEFPEQGARSPLGLGGTPVTISLYVEDADAVFQQAVAAGAQVRMPPMDMFWGDRYGQVTDPFGHIWAIATHKEDLTPEEINQRAEAAFKSHAGSCAGEHATA